MAMVRHLVDTVGIDVNKLDVPRGSKVQGQWGTPLEYIVCMGREDIDAHELVWYMLDRGADPEMALIEAKTNSKQTAFIEWVDAWEAQGGRERLEQYKERKRQERWCSVQ